MTEESCIIEDAHLLALAQEAEEICKEEMNGRDPARPSVAAINYSAMADTCRRFASFPHNP